MKQFSSDTTVESGRTRLGRFGIIVLAVLLVSATVTPFVGTVSAATVYTDTVTGSPKLVVVDGSDVDGEMTIEMTVSGDQLPNRNQDTMILRETVGNGAAIQQFAFLNLGVYESVQVRVEVADSATGEPTIGTGDGLVASTKLGSSGGDANLDCSLTESLNNIGRPRAGIVDCSPLPTQGINTTELNKNETHISVYQTTQQTNYTAYILNNSYSNFNEGYENDALIAGKNAYVKALVNGTSESVARSRARQAVRDYWTIHQISLIKKWNKTAKEYNYVANKVLSSPELNSSEVFYKEGRTDVLAQSTLSTDTTQTVNGTTVTNLEWATDVQSDSGQWRNFSIANALYWYDDGYDLPLRTPYTMSAAPYESSDVPMNAHVKFARQWLEIRQSSQETVDAVDTFANQTYEEYQEGQINTSDLIDPYLARSELGPVNNSDYQTWVLETLGNLGARTPDALESTGRMVIVDNETNTTYEGILLSQELPANDTFEVGTTYNASTIGGGQFVATPNGTVELTGEFTPTEFVTKDGTEQDSVQYKNITYETADLSEYKSLMENLTQLNAEIDALQQDAATGGGGGLPGPDLTQQQLVILAIAGGAVILLLSN